MKNTKVGGNVKPKTCKLCSNKRYANTSWCFTHYKEHEKRKKQIKEMKKIEKKSQSKIFIDKTRKQLHAKAWTLMSRLCNPENLDKVIDLLGIDK